MGSFASRGLFRKDVERGAKHRPGTKGGWELPMELCSPPISREGKEDKEGKEGKEGKWGTVSPLRGSEGGLRPPWGSEEGLRPHWMMKFPRPMCWSSLVGLPDN